MDAESNADFDPSESWFLVDIDGSKTGDELVENDDSKVSLECGPIVSEVPEKNAITFIPEPTDSLNNSKSASRLSKALNIASSSEHSKDHQDFQVLYKVKVFQNDYDLEKRLSDYNCSKSSISEAEKLEVDNKFKDIDNDTDGISIISESECNDFKVSAYETDEIWEGKVSESSLPAQTHPVLKRKRKRLKLNYRESSEESINSDFMNLDEKYYTNIQNIDVKKDNEEGQVNEYQTPPVYRHYRNNVANTMLSLAMGVIFTGVACIAMGHFLGVHNAQQTAGEMMETLKRLQMENVLLHTRLTQLSRAFFSKGNKLELGRKPEPGNCLNKHLDIDQNIPRTIQNPLPQTEGIESRVLLPRRQMDFPRVQYPIRDAPRKPSDQDHVQVSQTTHDQENYFNISKHEKSYVKTPLSSTTPINSGHKYQKDFLSERRLLNAGSRFTLNEEPVRKAEVPLESNNEEDCDFEYEKPGSDDGSSKDCLAVREKDLSRLRWFLIERKKRKPRSELSKTEQLNETVNVGSSPVFVYKFPQPEGYYENEKDESGSTTQLDPEEIESNQERLNPCDELKFVRNVDLNVVRERCNSAEEDSGDKKKKKEKLKRNTKAKKEEKKKKKEQKIEGKGKGKNSEKDGKQKTENIQKNVKFLKGSEERFFKKYKNDIGRKNRNTKDCRRKGDRECDSRSDFKPSKQVKERYREKVNAKTDKRKPSRQVKEEGKRGKMDEKKSASWEKIRRVKRESIFPYLYKRASAPRPRKVRSCKARSDLKSGKQSGWCEECSGKSNIWFYKWAKGREKYRRNRKMTEWQFERAQSRAESRLGDADWQFSRAMARESSRDNKAYVYLRK